MNILKIQQFPGHPWLALPVSYNAMPRLAGPLAV
jgi:hypothetical protein